MKLTNVDFFVEVKFIVKNINTCLICTIVFTLFYFQKIKFFEPSVLRREFLIPKVIPGCKIPKVDLACSTFIIERTLVLKHKMRSRMPDMFRSLF